MVHRSPVLDIHTTSSTSCRLLDCVSTIELLSCFRDMTGKFPEYPDEDDGGSSLLFKEKDPAELERELKEKVGTFVSESA